MRLFYVLSLLGLLLPNLSFAQKFDYAHDLKTFSLKDVHDFENIYEHFVKSLIFFGWTGQDWSVPKISNVLAYDNNLIPYEFLNHDKDGRILIGGSRFEDYRIYGPLNSFAILSPLSSGKGFWIEWKNFPKSYCQNFLKGLGNFVLIEVNGVRRENQKDVCFSRYNVMTLDLFYSDVEKFIEDIQKEAKVLNKDA